MKKQILLLLFGISMIPSIAQESEQKDVKVLQMTLEDCLEYAMGNSYTRQQMVLSEKSNKMSYRQSKLERLPSLSASFKEGLNHENGADATWSGLYSLDANITLFQGGSINTTIKQNRLYGEQAALQTSQYDNELIINILQSFLNVLGYEELLGYQDFVIAASEEQLKQGKEQYAAGKILESDYLMLEAQFASDMNNKIETQANRDNSLFALKTLLSMDIDYDLQIIYPDTASLSSMTAIPSMEYVLERANASLPDLEILKYGVDIAKTNLKLSQSSYYPTLSLSAGIGTGHAVDYSNFGTQLNDRFNQQVSLTLSVPIFSKGRTKTKVSQSRIALEQAELDQKQGELSVRQTIAQEYYNVNSALSKYNASTIKENAYKKTFEAYRVQFDVGAITAVDLLQQQNNYINALNDYVQSKYSFMLKRKVLDVFMGEEIKM